MKKFLCNDQLDTIKVGHALGDLLNPGDVVLLEGDLSAGKTTFTKGIGEAFKINRVINSPTFTIVKTYTGETKKLYHMDLYRLDGLGEDFDLYEYFEGDGVCVVEWPHQVEDVLPSEYILVNIKRTGETTREIEISSVGDKYKNIEGELNVHFNN